jgi:hypothetical protein
MGRREEWRVVLDAETERWSGKSCEQLIDELREVQAYTVEAGSKQYQVEVEILEDTKDYVHIALAVDDGSIPWSFHPESRSFIRRKDESDED